MAMIRRVSKETWDKLIEIQSKYVSEGMTPETIERMENDICRLLSPLCVTAKGIIIGDGMCRITLFDQNYSIVELEVSDEDPLYLNHMILTSDNFDRFKKDKRNIVPGRVFTVLDQEKNTRKTYMVTKDLEIVDLVVEQSKIHKERVKEDIRSIIYKVMRDKSLEPVDYPDQIADALYESGYRRMNYDEEVVI